MKICDSYDGFLHLIIVHNKSVVFRKSLFIFEKKTFDFFVEK